MYHSVIFDLDGTLLDTLGDLTAAANHVCRENGWPEHTAAEIQAMVGNGIPKLVHRFSPESARSPLLVASTIHKFNCWYSEHNMDLTAPYEGIPELLRHLKDRGVKLAVCSNKADQFTREMVEYYFPGMFDVIRGNLPGTPTKPDPGVARGILEKLGAKPEETLMVGDSDVDVFTGHNAGLRGCGVTWGFRSREVLISAGADLLAESVEALEEIILA